MRPIIAAIALCALPTLMAVPAQAQTERARDLGIPFEGTPGALNAITDVPGVTVGMTTLIEGDNVRTGVTAILPRGRDTMDRPSFAGWFSQNGNGEMTGTAWIDESGFLEGPVMITNTHSVGVVRDAVIQWRVAQGAADATGYYWSLPVVAETWDGDLNDINGFHVTPQHVFAALDSARGGPVAEGSVGGGTGMVCYEFKCGTGTASRVLSLADGGYTLGVLVQANHGLRSQATVAGVPIGRAMPVDDGRTAETGSIIIVIATDAPLLPTQLQRLARRATMGLARTGAVSGNGSGDIFLAFSTANPDAGSATPPPVTMLANGAMDPLFTATVDAVEEAIVNAMTAGRDMTGNGGYFVPGMDRDRLRSLLAQYGRLAQ